MIELNKIYNQDCLEGMKEIPDGSVDCLFSDVPYICSQGGCSTTNKFGSKNKWRNNPEKLDLYKKGKIFKENTITPKEYLPEMFRVMKPTAHGYIMVNSKNLFDMGNAIQKQGFIINNVLGMIKNNCVTNQWYMKNGEFTIFFRKGNTKALFFRKGNAKALNNCGIKSFVEVTMPSFKTKIHDTQKPLDYVQQLVENSTQENDIVLDPFMGSGTTAIACMNTNRNFIGFELDKTYFDLANKRIENHKKEMEMRD